jgi:simple sugar transport system substrate-binding protein
MIRLRYAFFILALFFPCSTEAADERIKIAFVHQGDTSIPGWTYQHDLARRAVEKFFGDKIEVETVEKLQPGADAERIIIGLARTNHRIIFVSSSDLSDAVSEAAKRFPDIYFEVARGKIEGDNIAVYNGRFYQARYILGQVAARAAKKGVIGYIATTPEPETICEVNAFMLGAQSINPDIELVLAYAGDKRSALDEASATRAVINEGAEVLSYQTYTPAPVQIAEQNGVMIFGDASDMASFAPQMQIGSIVHDWSGYSIRRISALMEGKWKPTHLWAGLREGIVTLGEFKGIDERTRNMAIDTRQKLIDDKLKIFTGPIFDRESHEKIKNGEVASDDVLKTMDWYVKGKIKILKAE